MNLLRGITISPTVCSRHCGHLTVLTSMYATFWRQPHESKSRHCFITKLIALTTEVIQVELGCNNECSSHYCWDKILMLLWPRPAALPACERLNWLWSLESVASSTGIKSSQATFDSLELFVVWRADNAAVPNSMVMSRVVLTKHPAIATDSHLSPTSTPWQSERSVIPGRLVRVAVAFWPITSGISHPYGVRTLHKLVTFRRRRQRVPPVLSILWECLRREKWSVPHASAIHTILFASTALFLLLESGIEYHRGWSSCKSLGLLEAYSAIQ